ncbi:MAG TPA: hypothetical protein VGV09_20745 [Steroidobacteraceae bacterium]|nr:hypothetical protein [Steroidobacteraceae bacterium]
MIKKLVAAAAVCLWLGLSGCATIVHSGPRAIDVGSSPPGATVSIYDRTDTLVMKNTTPFVAQLNTKFGYFKAQNYRLVFEMQGHATVEAKIDSSVSGWYFGNLLFGGLIGMVIVDPLTGAMYNLEPEKIEQTLTPSQGEVIRSHTGVLVVMADQATEHERAQTVPVN